MFAINKFLNKALIYKLILLFILISLIIPTDIKYLNHYQTSYESNMTDYDYKIGNFATHPTEWIRIYIGFPFQSINIDIQWEYKLLQAKIASDTILMNCFLMTVLALFIRWLIFMINNNQIIYQGSIKILQFETIAFFILFILIIMINFAPFFILSYPSILLSHILTLLFLTLVFIVIFCYIESF